MSSAPLLQLLATQARLSDGELAERLDMTEEAVRAQREQWEREGLIVGYQAVVNEEYEHDNKVAAFIEVKMTPERDGGFDRLAMRISRFDEVSSCYLASGGFDLPVTRSKNSRMPERGMEPTCSAILFCQFMMFPFLTAEAYGATTRRSVCAGASKMQPFFL